MEALGKGPRTQVELPSTDGIHVDASPDVCLRCDAAVNGKQEFVFRRTPLWLLLLFGLPLGALGLIPGAIACAIIEAVVGKKMRLRAGVCEKHKDFFKTQWMLTYAVGVVLLAIPWQLGLLIIYLALTGRSQTPKEDLILAPIVIVVGFVSSWAVRAYILRRGIWPKEITRERLVLFGVSPAFEDAAKAKEKDAA